MTSGAKPVISNGSKVRLGMRILFVSRTVATFLLPSFPPPRVVKSPSYPPSFHPSSKLLRPVSSSIAVLDSSALSALGLLENGFEIVSVKASSVSALFEHASPKDGLRLLRREEYSLMLSLRYSSLVYSSHGLKATSEPSGSTDGVGILHKYPPRLRYNRDA